MPRLTNPTTSLPMGRSRLTSPSKDAISDDGTVFISVVEGEQIQVQVTINWLTNLSSAVITAKIVEGLNDGTGAVPTSIAVTPQITTLTILDSDPTDNVFSIVIPADLITSWDVQPTPDKPVYGFIGLEIDDGGVGTSKQVWKPLRGLVEVLYSAVEEV